MMSISINFSMNDLKLENNYTTALMNSYTRKRDEKHTIKHINIVSTPLSLINSTIEISKNSSELT